MMPTMDTSAAYIEAKEPTAAKGEKKKKKETKVCV
jgi:hypothetical protein